MKSRIEQSTSETELTEVNLEIFEIFNLLYHIDRVIGLRRLCISLASFSDIFKIAHVEEHSEFARCYSIISKAFYVRDLIKHLRSFISNCLNCLILQIRRHQSYEFLQSIISSAVSYHIISIDFILILSITLEEYDIILSITNKFTKKITLSLEKITYSAAE